MPIDILTLAAARAGKGGGSTSKYKQPDWGSEGEKIILPEATCEIDPESGMGMIMQQFSIVEGAEYIVNYNGTPYNCIAAYLEGTGVAVGNVAAAVGTGNTGEPFIVVASTDEETTSMGVYGVLMSFDGSASVTVSISSNVVHKIPKEYIDPPHSPLIVRAYTDRNLKHVTDYSFADALAAVKAGRLVYLLDQRINPNVTHLKPILTATDNYIIFVSFGEIGTGNSYFTFTQFGEDGFMDGIFNVRDMNMGL